MKQQLIRSKKMPNIKAEVRRLISILKQLPAKEAEVELLISLESMYKRGIDEGKAKKENFEELCYAE